MVDPDTILNPQPLGRSRCPWCSKFGLQHVGLTSVQCWVCHTIFPTDWLINLLVSRKRLDSHAKD